MVILTLVNKTAIMISNSRNNDMWEKITECESPYFREGVLIKFKTLDTAGDVYKYAIGVRIDHSYDISFVGFDGRSWGYGRCTLPEEARYENKEYTVSREWLIRNFIAIAEPEDPDDIWVCAKAKTFIKHCTSKE